ncbi:hypothetical protein CYLTODRAFT_458753 [Cylindrobasidium torrendii FP15055 ss-10]|uniref:Uncharacterized protein n=1 Tax=Cylindrobasidium torrendii FP15055 ss-10 TaxID=1314674 RepID=A0A0D7AWX3_9AGAR|nr:hypothetical protein CYLTODRAFT_458753 [Cylindrobasidium torrendii FP15055 ss-10]
MYANRYKKGWDRYPVHPIFPLDKLSTMYSESDSHIDFFVQHGESDRRSLLYGLADACTASLSAPECGPKRCWRFYTGVQDILETSVAYLDGLRATHPYFFTASLRFVTSPLGLSNDDGLNAVGKAAAFCTCPNDGNFWVHQSCEEGEIIDVDPAHCAEKVYGALLWISLAGISDITVESDGTFTFGSRDACFENLERCAREQLELTGNMPWPRNRLDILVNSPHHIVDSLWHCFRRFNSTNRAHSLSLLWFFLCIDDSHDSDFSRCLALIPDFPILAVEHIQLTVDYYTKDDGTKTPKESEIHSENLLTIIWMLSEVVKTIIFAKDEQSSTAITMKAVWRQYGMDIVCALLNCVEVYKEYGRAEGHAWFKAHEEKPFEHTTAQIVDGLFYLK